MSAAVVSPRPAVTGGDEAALGAQRVAAPYPVIRERMRNTTPISTSCRRFPHERGLGYDNWDLFRQGSPFRSRWCGPLRAIRSPSFPMRLCGATHRCSGLNPLTATTTPSHYLHGLLGVGNIDSNTSREGVELGADGVRWNNFAEATSEL
ncbi:hypothetical protein CVT26_005405 [Gymnopilus dilepis]|uniref:Uncharacterized protein n=1 Tax=Gymnopilus dilepis TaxID=231916 RepID=A0A409X2Y1_9AGAR|nr:hypothetical protein CVT26_005405 [Gymnopilus dilepis]